jgi:RND family efflux transporter MFP subunit
LDRGADFVTIARASTAVDTEKRYPAGTDTAKARAASGWREIARVDGIVQRRLYQEGSDVRAGAQLFEIDPRDMRAALEAAEADLRRAEAARVNAAQVVSRYEPLVSRKAISAQEYDAAVSTLHQAEAQAAQARASVDRARLQLSYTDVTTPIAGRAGRAQVTEGALVSATGATLMTTVEQLAPIYVTFAPSSSSILDINARVRAGTLRIPQLNDVEVHLILENGATAGPSIPACRSADKV